MFHARLWLFLTLLFTGCSSVVETASPSKVDELRALIAKGGEVEIPDGVYELTEPLVIRNGVTKFAGKSRESVQLIWKGPADKSAVHVDEGVWGANVGGFTIRNGTGKLMSGVGLSAYQLKRPAVYRGTCCGSNRYDSISIVGFEYGLKFGDAGFTATSENRMNRLSFYDCRVACLLTDYNTLNNHFVDINIMGGDFGILCERGGGETHVDGGSASEVGRPGIDHYAKAVFKFASGGNYSVRRYRQGEGGTAGFCLVAGTNTTVNLDACTVLGTRPHNRQVIDAYYDSILTIRNCVLDGHIFTSGLTGSLLVEQSSCHEKKRVKFVDMLNPRPGRTFRIEERGNVNYGSGTMKAMPDYIQRNQ